MTNDRKLIPIKVTGRGINSTRTDLTTGTDGEFSLVSDEPPERHGNNEGMLPLEAFLAGYVACTHVIMEIIARELDVQLADLEFAATGLLNPRGYMGLEHVSAPFVEVHLVVSGRFSGQSSALDTLKSQLQWRCPVAATLVSAGTQISEEWKLSAMA